MSYLFINNDYGDLTFEIKENFNSKDAENVWHGLLSVIDIISKKYIEVIQLSDRSYFYQWKSIKSK